jgi:hypothetical protein
MGFGQVYMWDGLDIQLNHSPDDGTEMVPEMLVISNQLTRLIAQEDFINVSHCESFRS